MKTVEQLRNVAQDLIASYDARLDAVGTIMDNSYQILDDFKEKRTKLSAELRETLAKRESLRKSDFDRMMNGILLSHEEKEKEIKQDLRNFLTEQKKEARELKDALMQGEVERMKKAQIGIERSIAEVRGLLKGFYEEQEGLTQELGELLTKGKDLKIRDLKDMTRNLETLTRTKEVKRMGLSEAAADIKALGQDMAASHVDRKSTIEGLFRNFQDETAQRQEEVSNLLKGFQSENAQRIAEVSKLMDGFRKENPQRQKEVRDLLASFQKENADRWGEVNKLMEGFRKESGPRRAEALALLEGFQSENAERTAEVRKLMEGFQKENEPRRAEVLALLQDFRKEHDQLVAAVKQMWSTVAGATGGTKRVSASSYAGAAPKKPARKGKKKPR